MKLSPYPMTIVAAIPQDHQFVSDSQEVRAIKEHIGEAADDYDAFFVKVGDGEYTSVYAMTGTIPYTSKLVSKLI